VQDEDFFRRIEAGCPPGSMIYQMPYVPFPEHPPPGRMAIYDHFRPYLHSDSLRWSYGAMKGRDADLWIREIAQLPPEKLVAALAYAGYAGIYINRAGYADQGAEVEDALSEILEEAPLVNADQSLLYFPLTSYAAALAARHTETDWRIQKEKTLCPVRARFGSAFSYPEQRESDTFRWSAPDASVTIENALEYTRQVRLEFDGRAVGPRPAMLSVDGPIAAGKYSITTESNPIAWEGTLPPGRHTLHFRCDGPKVKTPFAPYQVGFQLYNFSIKEVGRD
jgi:phosphoglycerol transferase